MTREGSRVGIVLLAAGRGTRFGAEPKLLARFEGRPLVRHAAEAALASTARPVVAVLGAHADDVRAALAGLDLVIVENADHAAGLSTSLRTGLAALPMEVEAAIVLLGDMPRVSGAHIEALVAAYAAAEPRPVAVVPVSGGVRGNPVLLDHRRLAVEFATLAGDRGAGPLLAGRSDVLEIPADAAVGRDVDTPAALAALSSAGVADGLRDG